jgi:sigma-B regulation protein RsbU (phosphoserine phosphatase)
MYPGDTLLLYTDGLTEAHSAADPTSSERYGEQALFDLAEELAPASPHGTVAALAALLESFGEGLNDDTALLAVGVPAATPQAAA